jgi:hypothetical protein
VSNLYILTIDLPILLQENMWTDMNVEIGAEAAQFPERIHKWDFLCSVEQPMIVTISFEILKQTASHPTQSAPQVSESL